MIIMKTGKKPVTVKLGTKARRVLTDAELSAVIEQTTEPTIIFYEYDERLDRNAGFFQEIREKNAFYFYGEGENPQEKLPEIVKDWLDGLNKLDDETEQHDKYEEVPQVVEEILTPPTEQTEELNARIDELATECERLKLDNKNKDDDIKNFFEEIERLKSEIRTEQNKLRNAENTKEKAEAELQTANEEIERLNTIEIEELKADKERAEKRISELDTENKELSAKAAEIEGLTSERDTLKSENERLNFEKQNWNTEKENLQNQKEDLQSRLADLNTLFAATQEQIDQNAENTAEKDLTIEDLKKQLDEQTAKQARFDAVINEQLTNLIPEYRGAAQIVTVCGSGGAGVSNAVLSLSGAFLGERVLCLSTSTF
ncbi:hypothetical protein FACS1894188_01310 [Clostridia bacterium]|nr:hypothetical protein FACS1894188_01310 [Clostridia bacterium]